MSRICIYIEPGALIAEAVQLSVTIEKNFEGGRG